MPGWRNFALPMSEPAKRGDNIHARVSPCTGGKGSAGRAAGLQAAGLQAQLSFSTSPPAPPENRSSCLVHLLWGFPSFKTLQASILQRHKTKTVCVLLVKW